MIKKSSACYHTREDSDSNESKDTGCSLANCSFHALPPLTYSGRSSFLLFGNTDIRLKEPFGVATLSRGKFGDLCNTNSSFSNIKELARKACFDGKKKTGRGRKAEGNVKDI